MKTTLRFLSGGKIECLHTEALDLRVLGKLEVQRATHLRFEPRTQQWEVRCARSRAFLFTHVSRRECLLWEQTHLQPGASHELPSEDARA